MHRFQQKYWLKRKYVYSTKYCFNNKTNYMFFSFVFWLWRNMLYSLIALLSLIATFQINIVYMVCKIVFI